MIPKDQLIVGAYYEGRCRNARVARWDGEKFWYWRYKWGQRFLEEIECYPDDDDYDAFVPEFVLDIPLP